MMPQPPKDVLRRDADNPNAQYTQNYSVIEDLAQA